METDIIKTSTQFQWLPWYVVSFGMGVGTYFMLNAESSLEILLAMLVLGICLSLAILKLKSNLFLKSLPFLLIISGTCLASWRTHNVKAPIWSEDRGVVWVRGTIAEKEDRHWGTRLLLADLDLWQPDVGRFPKHETPAYIRINVRTDINGAMPGDRIGLKAILLPPPSHPAYPGGYDFSRFAWFERIGATGYSIADVEIRKKSISGSLKSIIEKWRQNVSDRISNALHGEENWAVVVALLTGKRGNISEETTETLRVAGVGHLLAISGLHMALIMAGSFFIFRAFMALFPYIALRISIKKISAILALVAGALYLALSGMPISAIRAYIMVSFFFFAIMLDRTGTPLRPLSLAAAVILFFQPEALLTPSFQMSFAAATALIVTFQRLNRNYFEEKFLRKSSILKKSSHNMSRYIGALILSSIVAGFATAPFALWHFNHIAGYGVLANAVAIPLASFWIMPSGMIALALMPFGMEYWPLHFMAEGIDIIVDYSSWVSSLEGSGMNISSPPLWTLIISVIGGIWWAIWHTKKAKYGLLVAFIGFLSMLFWPRNMPDILFGSDAKLFAVKTTENSFAFSSLIHERYLRSRWLEHLGQNEPIKIEQAKNAGILPDLECSDLGCKFSKSGAKIFIKTMDNKITDNCHNFSLVINMYDDINEQNQESFCNKDVSLITAKDLKNKGTHMLWANKGAFRVEAVSSSQGKRLWTRDALPNKKLEEFAEKGS